jgi:phosphoribosyl 1,2-cyclic phosphate phosphodiesterase
MPTPSTASTAAGFEVTITVLGSGTSVGVPTVGCLCKVCTSEDVRDRRLRPSVLVSYQGRNVLVDTSPDFRYQALRARIGRIDAVLFTHSHADHIMGLDDLRPFNFLQRETIPIYASAPHLESLRRVFSYIFDEGPSESSRPRITAHEFDATSPVTLFGLAFQPLRLNHGKGLSYGFRFGTAAYLTDHSDIPAESAEQLHGLDVLFLDALRHNPHPTHSTVNQSLRWVEQLKPKRAFFTHISHDLLHARTEELLPQHVRLAYDTLQVTVSMDPSVVAATEATQ